MVNFKYGTGFSLLQSNAVGAVDPENPVTAGMVVHIDSSTGLVEPGGAATDNLGIAVNSSTDSDVLATSKIGVLMLDGNSIIETDQTDSAITEGNYADGTKLYTNSDGLITTTSSINRVIGYAAGIRQLPGRAITVNNSNGVPVNVQGPVTVLAIKLNA